MTAGDATAFLAVVLEVALYIHIGMVADDLDAVLVCTHGSIGAQTPELAGYGSFRNGLNVFV